MSKAKVTDKRESEGYEATDKRKLEGYEFSDDSKIGEGSFSIVYRGWHPLLEKEKAFKICIKGEFEENFESEAQILAQIPKHPHILKPDSLAHVEKPTLLDRVIPGDKIFYMGMKYVCFEDGIRNVGEYIDKKKAFDSSSAISIAWQVLSALSHVHSSGKMHLDIHPNNILIGPGFFAYLTDFNLARDLKRMETGFSRSLSLPGGGGYYYKAPEQTEPKRYEEICDRTDVYMFARVFNKMLLGENCGCRPTEAKKGFKIPAKLDDVIAKCLAHSPKDRPSAKEVLKVVEEVYYSSLACYKREFSAIDALLTKNQVRSGDAILRADDILNADDILKLGNIVHRIYLLASGSQATFGAIPDLSRIEQRRQADISEITRAKDIADKNLKPETEMSDDKKAKIRSVLKEYLQSYRAWKEYERLRESSKDILGIEHDSR